MIVPAEIEKEFILNEKGEFFLSKVNCLTDSDEKPEERLRYKSKFKLIKRALKSEIEF